MDVPVDHDDGVYLIERHIQKPSRAARPADAYAQHSQAAGVLAILAALRTAGELSDAMA